MNANIRRKLGAREWRVFVGVVVAISVFLLGANRVDATESIQYSSEGGNETSLDLILPDSPKPSGGFPVVLYIHGGGWVSGDKRAEGRELAEFLKAHGYATVSINYRLAPAVKHPTQIDDVAKAFKWLVSNGERYGLDTKQIFVAGGSAGGHLAALFMTDREIWRRHAISLNGHVKGVMLFSGIYDVLNFVEPGMSPTRVERAFGVDPEMLTNASPVAHLTRHNDSTWPVLITVTDHDLFGLEEQAIRFYSLLLRAKWPVELVYLADRSHYNQFRLGIETKELDERFVPSQYQDLLRLSGSRAIPDMLGPAMIRFLSTVRSGIFEKHFRAAWPDGLPTAEYVDDYTMSAPIPAPEFTVLADQPYDDSVGGTVDPRRTLDVYIPKSLKPGEKLGIAFYVHGGGFRAGDKSMIKGLMETLVRNKIIFVSVNYRLSPAVKFPTHAEDVAKALKWVHTRSPEFGGDPDRIAAIGISAGAHLVATLALNEKFLLAERLSPDTLKGVLAISGVYDIGNFKEPGVIPSRLAQAFGEDEWRKEEGSPQRFVKKGAPPFVVTFTDQDLFLVREGATEFYRQLVGAGVPSELVEIPGRDHFNQQIGIGRNIGFIEDTLGPVLVRFAGQSGLMSEE